MKPEVTILPPVLLTQEIDEIVRAITSFTNLEHRLEHTHASATHILPTFVIDALPQSATSLPINELVQRIAADIEHRPTLEVTLAFYPTPAFTSTIRTWAASEAHIPIRLHIQTRPEIAGGTIIAYAGKIYDFSLLKSLQSHEQV